MQKVGKPSFSYRFTNSFLPHLVLFTYTLVALFPIVLIVMNSFKSRKAIFSDPLLPPSADTFSLIGYETVIQRANFDQYFLNSVIVTVASIFLILLAGSMAAFALSEYRFKGKAFLGLYQAVGLMIPHPLGTNGKLRRV
jgi:raffinose/stachyose/melibiose transport system permease protein